MVCPSLHKSKTGYFVTTTNENCKNVYIAATCGSALAVRITRDGLSRTSSDICSETPQYSAAKLVLNVYAPKLEEFPLIVKQKILR